MPMTDGLLFPRDTDLGRAPAALPDREVVGSDLRNPKALYGTFWIATKNARRDWQTIRASGQFYARLSRGPSGEHALFVYAEPAARDHTKAALSRLGFKESELTWAEPGITKRKGPFLEHHDHRPARKERLDLDFLPG